MTSDPTPDRHREAREDVCEWCGETRSEHSEDDECRAPFRHPRFATRSPAGPEEPREGLRLHEWDFHGRTQRAVIGVRTADIAFHYRESDREAVEQVVALANAALATTSAPGTGAERVCPDCGLTAQRIGEVHIAAQEAARGTVPDRLADTGAEETPWVEDGVPNYAEWRARSDTGAEERLRAALTNAADAMDTIREGLLVKDPDAIVMGAESILRHAAREARRAVSGEEV